MEKINSVILASLFFAVNLAYSQPNWLLYNINAEFSNENAQDIKIRLSDIFGKQLFDANIASQIRRTNTQTINTSNLNAGIYFIEIISKNNRKVIKTVKY